MPDYLPDILSTQSSYGRFDKVGSCFHLSRQTAGVKTGLPAVAVSECHDAVMEEDAPLYSELGKKESQYHAGAVGVVFVHNLSHDTMSRCSSGVRSVIATTAGNLAMVHTFPNLSVLFSGRVHISLDNTSRGRSGRTNNGPQSDHTGAIHPISSIQPRP